MNRINWDETGYRFYEAGVDRGVLYPTTGSGVAWNGLISVEETPSGKAHTERYFDGQRYDTSTFGEEFEATLVAYTYPDEFSIHEGYEGMVTGQRRKPFGLSYRTLIGSDLDDAVSQYKIHIVYNALVEPPNAKHSTLKSTIDPTLFSWPITTKPEKLDGYYGAHLVIDTRTAYPWLITALEDALYGTLETQPMLPSPDGVIELFEAHSIFRVIDHGDGTWTATGPDEAIQVSGTEFTISWPSAEYVDSESYTLRSL